jgi:hypothetical protein
MLVSLEKLNGNSISNRLSKKYSLQHRAFTKDQGRKKSKMKKQTQTNN